MENFIPCKNTCWVSLMSYCSLISWELTDLQTRGKNNCLRKTKVIITFPSVSRKLSWATAKQKTPWNQSKFSFHRISPKISIWNWILWRALGRHKTKAAAVVMIKLIESARLLCPKLLTSHFSLYFSSLTYARVATRSRMPSRKHNIYSGNKLFNPKLLCSCTTFPYCWENHIPGSLLWPYQSAPWPFPMNLTSLIQRDYKAPMKFSIHICYIINILKCALYNHIKSRSLNSVSLSWCFKVYISIERYCVWNCDDIPSLFLVKTEK